MGKTRFTIEEAKRYKVQDNINGSSKFQGWTVEVIARYNELYKEVKQYRDTGGEGRAADERVWARYMVLCNVKLDSITCTETGNDRSATDLQKTAYEDDVDNFATLMVML